MKFIRSSSLIILFAILSFDALLCNAQVRLPQLVADGMVLQRDTKINLWGWASPGNKLKIAFNNKTYKAVTNAKGVWSVLMAAMKAGGPYQMDISSVNHITIHDILVGDVWFCSGQSNMVLQMERVKEKYPQEIANANYPQIRNFFIPTVSDVSKTYDDLPPGKWSVCNPQNVLDFGAASYFFAKQLYIKYHVPIGIINSSVGGTPIQAWISEQGIKSVPQYAARLLQLKDTVYLDSIRKKTLQRNQMANRPVKITDKGLTGTKTWFNTNYIATSWHHFWLPGYWADQGIKSLNGVVWFRKEINIPASMVGKPAKIYMGRIVDADFLYVNGVLSGSTTYQYPPRRYTLPDGVLKPGKNIIIVRAINTSGKGGFVPDKRYFLAVGTDTLDLRGDWQYKVGQVFEPQPSVRADEAYADQNEPSGLYNTMVAPAIQYNIKGVVWYQGETNANKPKEYAQLLPALIADWRDKWHNSELPFIYAQLPDFLEVQYSPSESQWAELREGQLQTLSVSHTAMAVTIGTGEWNDIHPLDKKDIGERLALGAEKVAYGDSTLVASGPIFKSAKLEGNKIVISFRNIGSGLIVNDGNELSQFTIAGSDHKYVWAKAVIGGDNVIVRSDAITQPKYVRYGWADNPEGANLYNKEGLPASPFTTDLP
jgi:sialate O-acetylesterase